MTSRDFCYWLQGFFELSEVNDDPAKTALTVRQVETIRNHLHMVFKHEIDPSHGDAAHQEELAKAHLGKFPTTQESGLHRPPTARC